MENGIETGIAESFIGFRAEVEKISVVSFKDDFTQEQCFVSIVPLKWMEYGVSGERIIIYPKPYSIPKP